MQINSLLSKLLSRRGIDKVEDLSQDEKVTLERYQTVLSGENLSVETIKKFCQAQIKTIENKLADPESLNTSNEKRIAILHVYLNILKVIEAPEAEREALEKYLTQLIEK